jgi:hypothetical protein
MQAAVATAVVALFAIAVAITGVHMAHVYDASRAACTANGTCDLVGNLFSGYGAIIDTVHLSIALPVVFGIFGAVLVAREIEQSTNVLVWTQSVTRRRWLVTKIAAALGGTIVISAIVTALVTWWSNTPNAFYGNRFEGAEFDTQNIVPIAYALFAVALGIAAGALFRRMLPAIAATVGAYVAVRLVVGVYLRPLYTHAVTKLFALTAGPVIPSGSWTINEQAVDASGSHQLPPPELCRAATDKSSAMQCLGQHGYHTAVEFQPASRYWHFQLVEAGLFVVLAAVLVTVAFAYTMRRDA